MKKFLISMIIVFMFSMNIVHADMGPKPSVDVEFRDIDEPFYATLLGNGEGYGPWHTVEEAEGKDEEEKAAVNAFMNVGYADYNYWGFITKIDKDNSHLHWSYYAPDDFILAIYIPSTGKVIRTEPMSRDAFEQYYICSVSGNSLEIKDNNNIPLRLLMVLLRVIITVAVELLIGFLFGFRSGKQIKLIVITNLITQFIVNFVFWFLDYGGGLLTALIIYVPLEIIIFIIEGLIYRKRLDPSRLKTWIYSLLANGITTYIGIFAGALLK